MKNGTRENEDIDAHRAGVTQHATTFVDRRAGGVHVVNQQDTAAIDLVRASDSKRPRDVLAPLLLTELDLRARRPYALQGARVERDASCTRQRPRQKLCLIESTPAQSLHVERHWHHDVVGIDRERRAFDQQRPERPGQPYVAAVLVLLEDRVERLVAGGGIIDGASPGATEAWWMLEAPRTGVVGVTTRQKRQPARQTQWRRRRRDPQTALATKFRPFGAPSARGASRWVEQIEQHFPKMAHPGMLCGDEAGRNEGLRPASFLWSAPRWVAAG